MRHDELGKILVKRLRDSGLDTRLVAKFCGVTQKTVHDEWLGKEKTPRGETLNRLWHLLAALDRKSPEYDDFVFSNELTMYLGRLLAFSVVKIDEAQIILGEVAVQTVWDSVRGDRTPSRPIYTAEQLKAEHDEELQAKVAAVRQEFGLPSVSAADTAVAPVAATQPTSPAQLPPMISNPDLDRFIRELAERLGGLLPAVRYMLSDEVSQEDRGRLRSLVGQENMFELTNALSGLVSERARNDQRARSEHGR